MMVLAPEWLQGYYTLCGAQPSGDYPAIRTKRRTIPINCPWKQTRDEIGSSDGDEMPLRDRPFTSKTLMAITYYDGKPLVRLYPLLTIRIRFDISPGIS